MKQLLIILAALSLFACHGGQTSSPQAEGDTVPFKYARLLTVVRYDGYTVATIKNLGAREKPSTATSSSPMVRCAAAPPLPLQRREPSSAPR